MMFFLARPCYLTSFWLARSTGARGFPACLAPQGVTILLIEQNARQALQMSDYGLVREQGRTRIENTASSILADQRIGQLFLGGSLQQETEKAQCVGAGAWSA